MNGQIYVIWSGCWSDSAQQIHAYDESVVIASLMWNANKYFRTSLEGKINGLQMCAYAYTAHADKFGLFISPYGDVREYLQKLWELYKLR